MGQHLVQGPIQAIIVDLVVANAEQVTQSGTAEPVFRDVQFTGGLAEAGQDQDGGHLGPRHLFTSRRQKALKQSVQTQRLPEAQAQPDVAKASAALQAEAA